MKVFGRLGIAAASLLSIAACVSGRVETPAAPVPYGPTIAVQATAIPLNPADPSQTTIGDFRYAGGVAVVSDQTSLLHGLSDLEVRPDGGVASVSDQGRLFTARLALDTEGRLVGLTQGALRPLLDPQGQPLTTEAWWDAEDLAFLGGEMLVSFEQTHRIWLYPSGDRPPVAAPIPAVALADNDGLEGLAAAPAVAPDAYWAGIEPGGIFLCRLTDVCHAVEGLPLPPATMRLSGLATGPGGELVILHHVYTPGIGSRIVVSVVREPLGAKQVIGRLTLPPSSSTDNFEGVSVVARPDGRWRIYLLSDDNFRATQRTLLLAFDWTPPR